MKKLLTIIATAIISADTESTEAETLEAQQESAAEQKNDQHAFAVKGFSCSVSQFTVTLSILAVLLISTLLIYTGTADTALSNLTSR